MKGSLSKAENTLVFEVCDRAGDGEDVNILESMDLGNGVSSSVIRRI